MKRISQKGRTHARLKMPASFGGTSLLPNGKEDGGRRGEKKEKKRGRDEKLHCSCL